MLLGHVTLINSL